LLINPAQQINKLAQKTYVREIYAEKKTY